MNRLRGFRHFVRYVCGADIEVNQLNTNLDLALKLHSLLPKDVERFLASLNQD
ncbi:MAG: hypothetical protein IGS50_12780 [Synechococcales cyanobacterium C42_A2020_086]|jgi:hypothetical protein|nr:hypothetical protein [Synechococcales cyanobacterium C42_A2020_086]